MGTEWYLADTKHRRVLLMGKNPGRMLSHYLRHTAPVNTGVPIDAAALRGAIRTNWTDLVDAGFASADVGVDYLDAFAVNVWAFCAAAGWAADVRSDAHDYADEVYEDDDPRATPTGWAVVGSWYIGEALDPDPLAEEQARWEAVAREAMQCSI